MVNAFSFCLYNSYNPLYYDGLTENIKIIHKYYPDWAIYVYIGNDVTEEYINTIFVRNVRIIHTNATGHINMAHRFLAIEQPGVDLMIVRDADSRVHWKDRWAINEFVNSPYLAHTIRDNPVHAIPMLGGLWGLKRKANVPVLMCFEHYNVEQKNANDIGKDQTFLNFYIWPRVKNTLLVHTSITYREGPEHIVFFPFPYTNDIYCGRVEGPDFKDSPGPVVQTQRTLLTIINRNG